MKFNKVIDLSHPLHAGREARRLDIKQPPAPDITGTPTLEGLEGIPVRVVALVSG